MKCPICKCRTHVEIDLHADGYSQDLRECTDCGSVWTFKNSLMVLVVDGNKAQGTD